MYVSVESASTVTVLDARTHTIRAVVPAGTAPGDTAVDTVTNRIVARTVQPEGLSVIDGRTDTLAGVVPQERRASAVDVDPVRGCVSVANLAEGSITTLPARTLLTAPAAP